MQFIKDARDLGEGKIDIEAATRMARFVAISAGLAVAIVTFKSQVLGIDQDGIMPIIEALQSGVDPEDVMTNAGLGPRL
ncbi:MAG: hypothetical protein VYD57_14940 [Pseudomonadota bacterium]|nr:hypothetical protein [Pseudomonadota bacterium]